ncbi:dihydrolipoyl dehydrogenase family protein [Thalassoglobus polymorphus]|uniref:Glutathione amide reductase n=1 Tax=Thalassoglobus polymorphus TaxID=2527994 RepID=A0A517QL82_9PLAN|nr:NAD(P)/FAD-dependent oxidoreductase [Thalassoglobus polymorphus]QDT32371.1 Glutathione amide reductase [Thalassoglobus polymorphus]
MNSSHFDVIVLGTGPAGSTIARKAAKSGHNTAIIESREFGGTCALRGCNPKKVYVNAASIVDQVQRADGKLINDCGVAIDWAQLLAFKKTFTEPVAEKSERSFHDDGIATFQGIPAFTSQNEITVNELRLRAKKIVIATGAKPAPLDIPGEEWVIQSDQFMELKSLPDRVLFVGGGYVSMEFAHVVARCGKSVTVVDHHERVLNSFDPDLVKLLQGYSEKCGIRFRFGSRVVAVEIAAEDSLKVVLEGGDTIDCDLVVHGAGRVPSISDLQLEAGNVKYEANGIVVDDSMRSVSNPDVYAAGDCAASGQPKLTPTANEEARIIAKNLFADNPELQPSYGQIPQVVFTIPSIAAVGMSEQQAREMSPDIDVRFNETSRWGSNRKTGDTVAGFKVILDKQSNKILGAHLLGPDADEMINLFALAQRFNLSAKDLKSALFAFPTSSADLRQMV